MDYRISILEGQIELLKKQREWDKDEIKYQIKYQLQGYLFWTLNVLFWICVVFIWVKASQTP